MTDTGAYLIFPEAFADRHKKKPQIKEKSSVFCNKELWDFAGPSAGRLKLFFYSTTDICAVK